MGVKQYLAAEVSVARRELVVGTVVRKLKTSPIEHLRVEHNWLPGLFVTWYDYGHCDLLENTDLLPHN